MAERTTQCAVITKAHICPSAAELVERNTNNFNSYLTVLLPTVYATVSW